MISTTIFPGRYIQGYGAVDCLGEELKRFGQKGFIICDPFVFEHLLPTFQKSLETALAFQVVKFSGECADEEIERSASKAREAGSDVIVGIGGGKTLDTAKATAHTLKIRVAIVPTIASTDAPCSALAVIYTLEGAFKRYLILPKNPDMVVVDTKVIAQAPVRFLVSGMGDALATWFEADSCQRSYAGNMTGNLGSMTAYALARLCYDTLLNYGVLAKTACQKGLVVPALERVVEANTLLSGLGFESGGLGAAHAIHNGLTTLEATRHYYHGEKVAIGTLASLFLTDKSSKMIDQVYNFCKTVGLPTTLDEIGLGEVSDEDLMKAATAACAPGETIHNEPIPVTPSAVFNALKAADAEGHSRKG
jgi:glycerol dehydrogenase